MKNFNSRVADKFVVRLPDDVRDQLSAAADEQHISMNTFFVQAVMEKLDRRKRHELALDALEARAAGEAVQMPRRLSVDNGQLVLADDGDLIEYCDMVGALQDAGVAFK